MSEATSIREANRKLAREINHEARSNPQSAYSGKFVGIANGRVIETKDAPAPDDEADLDIGA
jgi:hypothetical protein